MSHATKTSDGFFDSLNDDERRLARRAMILFGRILAELDITGFSFGDLSEAFNSQTPYRPEAAELEGLHTTPVRYTEKHLRFLVKKGLLERSEIGVYAVRELPEENPPSTDDVEPGDVPLDPLQPEDHSERLGMQTFRFVDDE